MRITDYNFGGRQVHAERGNSAAWTDQTSVLEQATTGGVSALTFILEQQRSSANRGAFIDSKVRGRVLETALLLHLLRKHDLDPKWQERLHGYVSLNAEAADPFSQLVATSVLDTSTVEVQSTLGPMLEKLEYGKCRKRAFLKMILVEVGLVDLPDTHVLPAHFSSQATHRFSKLYCSALRLIYNHHSDAPVDVAQDIEFLHRAQAKNGSWEQQSLITLMALLSMQPDEVGFRRGLKFLRNLERPEGGIPFCDNQNVWVTALAGLALQAAGVQSSVVADLAEYIASQQHDNGAWSFTEGVQQTDTDDTANCVQVLLQHDPKRYSAEIDQAFAYFETLQREDGGYPTYEIEGEPELTMTANILLVKCLAAMDRPNLRDSIRRAASFLVSHQKTDGSFERSWSLAESYSVFRVLWALEAAEPFLETTDTLTNTRVRALAYIRSTQNLDGGWGQCAGRPSDGLSTAYALSSLTFLRHQSSFLESEEFRRAVGYLLSQQDPSSGEVISIPDVAGPRPIVFDTPLLSTIFSAMAFFRVVGARPRLVQNLQSPPAQRAFRLDS